ncbi:MAG: bifunctional glutamate N-acetyltransferase/amino-acid acetyltransferase ArgJ [Planctomycetaceae bacterium]|nr:bifunctional glutamate N-acetyltransferase/amino-acid acetyltransferase ArgJ [Planctomycetaceae bacterium]
MSHVVSASLPRGFQTCGFTCGIKASGKSDLALFVSEVPAAAAGVFTQNRVCGAPVTVSRSRVPRSTARAVVISSGNSNAATGAQGILDAQAMTQCVADQLGCAAEDVAVASTGVIGVPLPLQKLLTGIPQAAAQLGTTDAHLHAAASAIMTTDTFPKLVSIDVTVRGQNVRVAGVAKGAAMIAPNMATMLSVIMTDAELTQDQAVECLRFGVDRTFNCISVDGHTSTSDTVLLLANGQAGVSSLTDDEVHIVRHAIQQVCRKLATDIIRDAEGADHFITVDVTGLETRDQAYRMAKAIADSPLVKTAIVGADPNWGRIVSAAGYAGVDFDTAGVSLQINGIEVYRAGVPVEFDAAELSRQMKENREVDILLSVSSGPCSGNESVRFWTSDLTAEYVRLNSEYTT